MGWNKVLLLFVVVSLPSPPPTPLTPATCCTQANLRPKRLLRGFSTLIVAVVYHLHWTKEENDSMRGHLFQSLSLAESRYANCALIVAGNFNCLCINSLKKHFRLHQIVKKPTRKNAILDIVLTWTCTNITTSRIHSRPWASQITTHLRQKLEWEKVVKTLQSSRSSVTRVQVARQSWGGIWVL